jgi:Ca2+:H+ antiporter
MLILVVVALLLPAIFDLAVGAGQSRGKMPRITDEALSLAVSLVLLLLYGGNLLYTLVTHRDVFTSVTEDRPAEPGWGLGQALAILAGATIAIAFGAEMVSGALDATARSVGLPILFLGVIPLAVIGTSSDVLAAIAFGRQNRMNLAVSICIGSAIQAALVIAPLLVLASWAIGHPMTLVFDNPLDLFAIGAAAFIVNAIAIDGKTTWFEGLLLVGVYILLALAYFFMGSA